MRCGAGWLSPPSPRVSACFGFMMCAAAVISDARWDECTHGPPRAVALADGCPAIINARSGWDPRFRHGCMYAARKGMEKGRGEAAGGMAWQAALCEQGVWDGKSTCNSGCICIFAQRCAGRLGVGHDMTGCVLCTRSRRTGAHWQAGSYQSPIARLTSFFFPGVGLPRGCP